MALPLLALGALAAGGTALSAFGGYKSAKAASKTNTEFLDPYNTRGMAAWATPLIQERTKNQSVYGGDYAAPMTDQETEIMNRQARLSAMGEGYADQFQPGVINPEVDATEFKNLQRKFYGDGFDPGVKALTEEQFAGPSGSYWGGARAKGVMDAYGRTVTDPYQNFRSEALQKSYQNALDYQARQSETNVRAAEMSALPRQIKQYGLDKQYDEWVRGREEMADYMNKALQYLSVTGMTQTTTPGKPDPLAYIASGAGNFLSSAAMIGAMQPNVGGNIPSGGSTPSRGGTPSGFDPIAAGGGF